MLKRALEVSVSGAVAGHLYETAQGRFALRFSNEYRHMAHRPVLGQRFEDDLFRTYTGNAAGRLPSFFANLLPEDGRLKEIILRHLDLVNEDDLSLFAALAGDLPGAIEATGSRVPPHDSGTDDSSSEGEENSTPESDSLRFSLAGVQLKFSMVSEGNRLTLPAHGLGGDWIVKLAAESEWPGLAENEGCMLDWAQASGFEVPSHRVIAFEQLSGIRRYVKDAANALAIKRFDRESGRRIHQEDFAQVVGVPPASKYNFTQDKLFALIARILGSHACEEAFRRFVFSVASGNADAHLKNWSLVYRDGIQPSLAPLYDQVSTVAWPSIKAELSLKWMDSKRFESVDADRLGRAAARAGLERDKVVRDLQNLVVKLRQVWPAVRAGSRIHPAHAERLSEHWQRVPVLQAAGPLESDGGREC